MKNFIQLTALGLASAAFTACTTTGNIERSAGAGAAGGAAIGAGIGAVSGDVKVGEGALAGAVVGGIIGGIYGNNQDNDASGRTDLRPVLDKSTRYFDDNTGRYYYYERGTSRTFYENFEQRS